jgi:hypothetical protein
VLEGKETSDGGCSLVLVQMRHRPASESSQMNSDKVRSISPHHVKNTRKREKKLRNTKQAERRTSRPVHHKKDIYCHKKPFDKQQ